MYSVASTVAAFEGKAKPKVMPAGVDQVSKTMPVLGSV